MKKSRAFTLIELLVVIAIIALLLAILMPSLRLAKEMGRNLSCRANIRALSVGFRLYAEANDGKVFGYGSVGGHNLWLQQIANQLGDVGKIRYCPSTKRNETIVSSGSATGGSASETWIWNVDVPGPEHGSYGINGFIYSNTSSWIVPAAEWESSRWKSANATANSAAIPIFVDARWVDLWPQDNDTVAANHDLDEGAQGGDGSGRNHMLRCMIARHGGALSVSFLDGHVEPVHLKQMWSLKWSRQFVTDGEDVLRTDDTPIY